MQEINFSDTPILDLAKEKQIFLEYFKFITMLKKSQVQLKPVYYK